ncbi:hypothetical protein PLESTB_000382900 [Pleodorina starrii]|uniref:G-patch domain-containing protein n=1 Tax=Pleodorina starrii TaxID=330485 RepID=A0A9W6BE23_9CHLO|nr:hypothetical protein PLESTM_000012100 [Pleodorina starrii]GLC50471.1 hypothetical protein PLESTB_000382900 [Pleodorina starrii]GLC73293.1 hypothetical protein PLESTF_001357200 [Pleodorina starrii]
MADPNEFQHFERFDMENDYEGGQWVNGEFYYSKKRQKRMQSKEDQIYGVFAEDSDDSDGDRRGRRRDRGDRGERDYTKPVGFVSSGKIVQDTTKADEEEGQPTRAFGPAQRPGSVTPMSEGDDDAEEQPSFAHAGLGLGSRGVGSGGGGLGSGGAGLGRGGGGGLGFKPGGSGGANSSGRGGIGIREDEEDEEEAAVMPSAFGKRILEKAQQRLKKEEQAARSEAKRSTTLNADPTFATFEKHTKGIGLKLLEKMGYKPGEGLGRDKQGIAKPVEARMRPKGMALGFGEREEPKMELPQPGLGLGHSRAQPGGRADGAARDQDGAKAGEAGVPVKGAWKKKAKEVRVRREYRTADQVLAEAAERPLQAQPILDMRGPQARVITNLQHLNEETVTAAGDKTPMPELQHNLRLLVDLAEAAIQKLDAKLRHEQDTATLLVREKQRLEEEDARQAEACARLEAVAAEVAVVRELPAATPLGQLAEAYGKIRERYREEYIMYGLAQAALAQVLPRMQALLRGWEPLAEPSRGAAEMRTWKALLQGDAAGGTGGGGSYDADGSGGAGAGGSDEPYTQLVWEVVLPPVRSAALNGWQPRDPEPLLKWLEAWEPLLPPSALGHILGMLVMPKLRTALTEWEPRHETVPIHAWLFPWLPYLGQALDELYPHIRHKLDAALQAWHPSDGSALVLLSPWQRVWGVAEWDAFMAKAIVPKLALALGQMDINPAAQQMEPWVWAMAWKDVISAHLMAGMLERVFFPRWHAVLQHWLTHGANFDEVTRWYLGWKSSVPQGILDHERVRAQFNAALNTMNSVLEDGTLPPQPAFAPTYETAGAYAAAAAAGAAAAAAASRELTLRDLVMRFAEENGVEFQPKPGRNYEGLQVYSFGSVSVVLDNTSGVIRAQLGPRWAPVSLEQLQQLVVARRR